MTDRMAREIIKELKETNSLLRRMSEAGCPMRTKTEWNDESIRQMTERLREFLLSILETPLSPL